jgi:CheY-like chemotaxis protein
VGILKEDMNIDTSKGNSPTGLILFIDDDKDEHHLFKESMKQVNSANKIKTFFNGQEALDFITSTKEEIFFIISDVNMPKMDGMELKRRIESNAETRAKAIPFVFHSNQTSPAEIRTAFTLSIQGFIKKGDYQENIVLLQALFYFWSNCMHPKDVT